MSRSKPLVVAMILTDGRDDHGKHELPEPFFGPAPSALLAGLENLPELEVHVVSCVHAPVRTPGQIGRNLFHHTRVVGPWGWLRGGYAGCVRAVRDCLREVRPDLVHGQGTERYCALSAVFSGYPTVVTVHGIMRQVAAVYRARPGSFYWLAARLERFALPQAAGVFCNSAHTEQVVRPLAQRTWRVPNAVRPMFFTARQPELRQRPVPVLLNAGLISPNKRQLELLELGRKLAGEGHRFELQFVGPKEGATHYCAEFESRVKQAEAAGWARYLGVKRAEEMVACFDAADALVHCAIEESFGLVAAEALARNLKVFAMGSSGIADIATGVEGAELFDVHDWDGTAEAIRRWLTLGSPRPETAADEMRARYHPEIIARRHLEIYREVLAAKDQAAPP